jgi:hypothetical protein
LEKLYIFSISLLLLILNRFLIKNFLSNNKTITIFQFYNIFYIVFIYIGAVSLNLYQFEYEDYYGFYYRKDILFNIWILSSSCLILVPLGSIFINAFLGFNSINFSRYSSNDVISLNRFDYSIYSLWFGIILLTFSFIAFFIYLNNVGDLAILHLFDGLAASELGVLRSDATNNFTGKLHRYQLFLKNIPNILLVVSFLLKNKNKYWLFFFFLVFISNIFFALLNVEKTPVIKIFILLVLAQQVLSLKISKILIFRFLLISFLLLFLLYSFVMGMEGRFIFDIFGAIFHRIFIGQVHPLFWWQLYLEKFGPVGFVSLPNPLNLFGFSPISLTVLVFNFAHPELVMSGIQGSMPTIFFAYWMLSFGMFFSFISMFFFGIIIQLFELFFMFLRKLSPNVYVTSFYIFMIDYFTSFIASGIDSILFDIQWIFSLIIVMFFLAYKSIFLKTQI